MKLNAIIGVGTALTGIVFATGLAAQEVTLRIAVVTPTDHPHSVSAREFARLVDALSGGEIAISVSDNGALGSNPELLAAVQAGIIDFTISTPGVMAEYAPVTGILELPYVFASMDHMMAVTRGDIGAGIAETYEAETGIAILGYMGGAQRNMITTDATITAIDDLEGLRMRTWEWDVMLNWWDSLGALGTVISFPEVYTALQTGVVDGAENEFSTFTTARWAEVAKNVSLTRHSITVRPLVGNAAALADLSEAHRAVILEAAAEAADFDVALEQQLDQENMARLETDYEVVFTEPDRAAMIAASATVIEQFAADQGLEDLAAAIAAAAN